MSRNVADELDDLFDRPADEGVTLAFLLVREGEIVDERYGVQPGNLFQPDDVEVTAETPLISWSMAKSMLHATTGLLVGDGRLDPADPAAVTAWAGTDKAAITLLDLLEMRSGLRFAEVYVEGETSHCLDMLFGAGTDDQAAYAAALPLDHPPGTVWNYSSGTSNIVSRVLGDIISAPDAAPAEREARDARLPRPAAVRAGRDARRRPPLRRRRHVDRARRTSTRRPGSSPASASCTCATAAPAVSGSCRLDGSTTPARSSPTTPRPGSATAGTGGRGRTSPGSVAAHGYEGQYLVVLPEHDAVLLHLGKTDATVRHLLVARLRRIIAAL